MKAKIRISGQVMSKHQIYLAISKNSISKSTDNCGNDIILHFYSIKEAKEAIKAGYKMFKQEDPKDTMLSKSTCNSYLSYDAGTAKIEKYN